MQKNLLNFVKKREKNEEFTIKNREFYLNNKFLGKICGNRFIAVRKQQHFFCKYRGFGINASLINYLKKRGVKKIIFKYLGKRGEKYYEIQIDFLERFAIPVFYEEPQLVVPLKYMREAK